MRTLSLVLVCLLGLSGLSFAANAPVVATPVAPVVKAEVPAPAPVVAETTVPAPVVPVAPLSKEAVFGAAGILALLIPFLVNLLKTKGIVKGFLVPVSAFGIGAVLGLVTYYTKLTGLNLFTCIGAGIAVGGSSTGLYSIQHEFFKAPQAEEKPAVPAA